MRKAPRPRPTPRPASFTPLTDDQIARSHAVEHVDGVGAIQSLDGRSAFQLSNGTRYSASEWRNSWEDLAELNVLEVRRSPTAEDPDTRYSEITGAQATFIDNNPSFYEWFPVAVSRPLADVKTDSNAAAFETYFRNAAFYQVYVVDADHFSEPVHPPADVAYTELRTGYNAHMAAVEAATDVRGVQAADQAFEDIIANLWRSPV